MQDPRITFFPKRRVRVELTDWAPKRNTQGEKRVRLDFTIPLIDEARNGEIPAWLLRPLDAMEVPESVQNKTKLEVELDGVTIELFDTPKAARRTELFTAATLTDFFLVQVTRDKQSYPALTFCVNVPRAGLLEFCDKYEECWLWTTFTPVDASKISPPAPGHQMTIADAAKPDAKSAAAGDSQSVEDARANSEAFFGRARRKSQDAGDEMPDQEPEAAAAVASIATGRKKGPKVN